MKTIKSIQNLQIVNGGFSNIIPNCIVDYRNLYANLIKRINIKFFI